MLTSTGLPCLSSCVKPLFHIQNLSNINIFSDNIVRVCDRKTETPSRIRGQAALLDPWRSELVTEAESTCSHGYL